MAGFATGSASAHTALFQTNIGVAACVVGLAAGVVCGTFSGVVFAWMKVPSFIVTLGALTIVRGITLVYSRGVDIPIGNGTINNVGSRDLLGIPEVFIIAAVVAAVCWVIASYTPFGRRVYAIGGGERVAALSGIPVTKTKIQIFVFAGALSALGGMVLGARTEYGVVTMGTGLELTAIAAVVIGGTPLTGGVGGPAGTVVGAVIITALNAGLNIVGVSPYWQLVIIGLVLVVSVVISVDRKRIGIIK